MIKIIRIALVYAIAIIAMLVILSMKKNYHVDEMLSFVLANNQNTWVVFDRGVTYDSAEFFNEQYAAQPGHQFDYAMVWRNQAGDCHPPLFYALLHTICSFTPGIYGNFQIAIINIIFGLLTLFMVRKILWLFGPLFSDDQEKYGIAVDVLSVLFFVSPGFLDNASFLRMYVMAMFMVTWVTYCFLKFTKEALRRKKIRWSLIGELFAASLLSALTHYYCAMYVVFINVTLGVILLAKMKFGALLFQTLSALSAAPSVTSYLSGSHRPYLKRQQGNRGAGEHGFHFRR